MPLISIYLVNRRLSSSLKKVYTNWFINSSVIVCVMIFETKGLYLLHYCLLILYNFNVGNLKSQLIRKQSVYTFELKRIINKNLNVLNIETRILILRKLNTKESVIICVKVGVVDQDGKKTTRKVIKTRFSTYIIFIFN